MRTWRVWGLLGASGAPSMQGFSHLETQCKKMMWQRLWHGRETIDWGCEPQGRCFYSCPHKLFSTALGLCRGRQYKREPGAETSTAVLLCNFLCFKSDSIPTWGKMPCNGSFIWHCFPSGLHPTSLMFRSSLKYFMDQKGKLRTFLIALPMCFHGALSPGPCCH